MSIFVSYSCGFTNTDMDFKCFMSENILFACIIVTLLMK